MKQLLIKWKIKIRNNLTENSVKRIQLFIVFILFFIGFYGYQETSLTNELDDCSYFTLFYPTLFHGTTLDGFYLNQKSKIKISISASFDDIGNLSKKEALKQRFLIQISCNDSTKIRHRAEFEIPNGYLSDSNINWKKIPKELKLRDADWDYNNLYRGKYIDWY